MPQDLGFAIPGKERELSAHEMLMAQYNEDVGGGYGAQRRQLSGEAVMPEPVEAVPADPSPEASPPIVPDSTTRPTPPETPKRVQEADYALPEPVTPPVTRTQTQRTQTPDVPQDAASAIYSMYEPLGGYGLEARAIPERAQLAPQQPAGDDESYLSHSVKGALSMVGDVAANLMGFSARMAEGTDTAMDYFLGPEGGEDENFTDKLTRGYTRMLLNPLGTAVAATDATSKKITGDQAKAMTAAVALRNFQAKADEVMSESYVPRHDFNTEFYNFITPGKDPWGLLNWMLEQAPQVGVQAAAAMYAAPAYFVSLVEDFATDRAVNDGRDPNETTPADYAWGSVVAPIAFFVDRYLGEGKTVGALNKMLKRVADEAPGAIKRAVISGLEGLFTEGVSGAVETAGTAYGTKTWREQTTAQNVGDVLLGGLSEGLAGAPVGAALGALNKGRPKVAIPDNNVSEDEQAAINTAAGGEPPAQGELALGIPEHQPSLPFEAPYQPPAAQQGPPAPPEGAQPTLDIFRQGELFGPGGGPLPPSGGAPPPPSGPGGGPPALTGPPGAPPPGPVSAIPTAEEAQAQITAGGTEEAIDSGELPSEQVPVEHAGIPPTDYDPVTGEGIANPDETAAEYLKETTPEQRRAEREALKLDVGGKQVKRLQGLAKRAAAIRAAPQKYASQAIAKVLTSLPERKAGVPGSRMNRERLSHLFTNLSDLARVYSEQLTQHEQKLRRQTPKKGMAATDFAKAASQMEDVAIHMAQIRALMESYASGEAVVSDVHAAILDPDFFKGLASLKYNAKDILASMLGSDVDHLDGVLNGMSERARGEIDTWLAETAQASESARISEEGVKDKPGEFLGGRGVRPELSEPQKREHKLGGLSEVELGAREAMAEEQKKGRDTSKSTRVTNKYGQVAATATAKDVYTDEQGRVLYDKDVHPWAYKERQMLRNREEVVEARREGFDIKREQQAKSKGVKHRRATAAEEAAIAAGDELRQQKQREAERIAQGIEIQAGATDVSMADLEEAGVLVTDVDWAARRRQRRAMDDAKNLTDLRIAARRLQYMPRHLRRSERMKVHAAFAAVRKRLHSLTGARDIAYEELLTRRTPTTLRGWVRYIDDIKQAQRDNSVEIGKASAQVAILRRTVQGMHRGKEETYESRGHPPTVTEEEEGEVVSEAEEEVRQEETEERIESEDERLAREAAAEQMEASKEEQAAGTVAEETSKEPKTKYKLRRERHATQWRRYRDADDHTPEEIVQLNNILSIARAVWNTRRMFTPPKFYTVLNPNAKGEADQFMSVRGMMPKIDPSKPGRQRYQPQEEGGREYYTIDQMENAVGWKVKETYRVGNSEVLRDELRNFPKNQNLFNPIMVDRLMEAIKDAGVASEYQVIRDIADTIVFTDIAKEKQTNRSGTGGYNRANRGQNKDDKMPVRPRKGAPRGPYQPGTPGTPTTTPPSTSVPGGEGGGGEGGGGTTTPPTEEPVATNDPPEEEPIVYATMDEEAAERLRKALEDLFPEGVPEDEAGRKRKYNSLVKEIQALIASGKKRLEDALALHDEMIRAVSDAPIEINEDGLPEMAFKAPDGWPARWPGKWWATQNKGETSQISSKKFTRSTIAEGPETPESRRAAFEGVIIAEIENTIVQGQNFIDAQMARLQELRDKWKEAGSGRPGPGPTRPTKLAPLEPPSGSPGAIEGDDDTGAAGEPRRPSRDVVDIFQDFERVPRSESAFISELAARVPEEVFGRDQVETAHSAVAAYVERDTDLGDAGAGLDITAAREARSSVTNSGYLVMSGTGSGKTRIGAAVAKAILAMRGGYNLRQNAPVLMMLKEDMLEDTLAAFKSLGLTTEGVEFAVYRDLEKLDKDIFKKHYAAVIFDEAHQIKGLRAWAQNATELNADFRMFMTATPTDQAGQELYYLRYILQNHDNMILKDADHWLKQQLGLPGKLEKSSLRAMSTNPVKAERWVAVLERLMRDAIVNNRVANYSLVPSLRNKVTRIPADEVALRRYNKPLDPGEHALTDTEKAYLVEQMKVPWLVRRTLDAIRDGEDVVVVFSRASDALLARFVGFSDTPPAKFVKLLRTAAAKEGVNLGGIDSLFGGKGGNLDIRSKAFRKSEKRVFVMTDVMGSTGLSLHDEYGTNPKRMLIAGTSLSGDQWVQLMGRIDRRSQESIPHAELVLVEGNDVDAKWWNDLKVKINRQLRVTGMRQAADEPTHPYSREDAMESKTRRLTTPEHVSPIDQMVQDRIAKGGETAKSLIDAIARNQTDPDVAAVAEALKGHPALPGIAVTSMTAAQRLAHPGAVGLAQGTTAYVSPDDHATASTALHEIFHHLTHWTINNKPGARVRLRAIMAAVPSSVTPGVTGVLSDPHEFVAEAYGNAKFRAALKNIKVKGGGNVWQRFVAWVKSSITGKSQELSAWDAIMELKLTDPPTSTATGKGNPSTVIHTTMTKLPNPEAGTRIAELLQDNAEGAGSKGFGWGLATMTFKQITKSFGKVATEIKDGRTINHLQRLYNLSNKRAAMVTKEQHRFNEQVLEKLHNFGTNKKTGRRKIKVQMTVDGPKVTMSAYQFLSELMNVSGYAGVHFGKGVTDPINGRLGLVPPKIPRQPGDPGPARTRSNVYWSLFKKQFDANGEDGLGAEGRQVYNELADFFANNFDAASTMFIQQWLDATVPMKDGTSWYDKTPAEARREFTRISKLSDPELKQFSIVKDSLERVREALQPGKVRGAYFPLRRFGEWVVKVDEHIPYKSESERRQLMDEHVGATSDGKNVIYKAMSRFESVHDARVFIKKMKSLYPNAKITDVLTAADLGLKKNKNLDPQLIAQFTARIRANDQLTAQQQDAQISMFTQSMIDLMPEASYADAFRPRQGVLGASVDVYRGLANYGSSFAHYRAAALTSGEQQQANRDFAGWVRAQEDLTHNDPAQGKKVRKLEKIRNELLMREGNSVMPYNEGRILTTLNNIGFAFYLVGASYNIWNMTQPTMVAVPVLAGDHGMKLAAQAMKRAYMSVGGRPLAKLAKTGLTVTALKGLVTGEDFDRDNYDILSEMIDSLKDSKDPVDQKHAILLRELADQNYLEATVAMDMTAAARTSHIDEEGNVRNQSKLSYLAEWMRMAPHITEVMNRSVTAVAAFDLEYSKQRRLGLSDVMATRIATQYAGDVVDETQFNYQTWNKPRVIQRNATARALLMFKQHPQHIYYLMISKAIRSSTGLYKKIRGLPMTAEDEADAKVAGTQLAYFIGMHALMVGAIGATPEPIKWIIGLLNLLFGDDDEPWDFERFVQRNMKNWGGSEIAGDILSRGALAAVGIDAVGRIGLNQMVLFDTPSAESPDTWMADVARIAGGPLASLGERYTIKAYDALKRGDYEGFAEQLLPKVLRDPLRAYNLMDEGFTTYTGKQYARPEQMSPTDYLLISLGFNPTEMTKIYMNRGVQDAVEQMDAKAGNLVNNFWLASGNHAARVDALNTIFDWNKHNPAFAISKQKLISGVKSRNNDVRNTYGNMLVPKQRRGVAHQWADF